MSKGEWAKGVVETGHGTSWKELSSWRGRENGIPWQERQVHRKLEQLYVRRFSSVFLWAPLMHHAFCSVQVFTDIISFNPRGFQRNKPLAWARPVSSSRSNSKDLCDNTLIEWHLTMKAACAGSHPSYSWSAPSPLQFYVITTGKQECMFGFHLCFQRAGKSPENFDVLYGLN